MSTWNWVTRVALGTVAVGVASAAGLLFVYQRALIYPSSFPEGSRTEVDTPDRYDLPFQEFRLNTPDREKLHVYLMLQKGSGDDEEVAKQRPTILMFHANAGNMGHRLPLAVVFYRRLGCNVVMLSYRGYGLSSGEPSEAGLRIDAQTLLDWVRAHPTLSKTKVIVYGQSIGGAVSIDLAERNPKSVYGAILENTFLSLPELIPTLMPLLGPFRFLCRTCTQADPGEYWPSGEAIRRVPKTMPILFLSGDKDELVPESHMRQLYEACASKNKEFHSFRGGMHNDTCLQPKYFDVIASFLLKYVIDPEDVEDVAEAEDERKTEKLAFTRDPDEEWDDERKASL